MVIIPQCTFVRIEGIFIRAASTHEQLDLRAFHVHSTRNSTTDTSNYADDVAAVTPSARAPEIVGRSMQFWASVRSPRNLPVRVIYGYHTILTCDNRVILHINGAVRNYSRMSTSGMLTRQILCFRCIPAGSFCLLFLATTDSQLVPSMLAQFA